MARIAFIIFIFIVLFISSCKKDVPVVPEPTGTSELVMNFNAKVYDRVLVPNTTWFANVSNDSFTVTKLTYYVSNIKMTRTDGVVFSEPESYHLIKHVDGKVSFTIAGIPEGTYNKVDFLIGIDSIRNHSGAQTGDLAQIHDMFWEWNSGYIFFKMEGSFNTVSQPAKGGYAIHIGGGSGNNNCLQKCTFNLATPIKEVKNKRPALYYNVQVDEIFVNPTLIDFTKYYNTISESTFKAISDNYKDMIVVDRVEN